jgi:hypothetical protein
MQIDFDAVELLYRQKIKLLERAVLWTMALVLVAVGAYTVQWEVFDAEQLWERCFACTWCRIGLR